MSWNLSALGCFLSLAVLNKYSNIHLVMNSTSYQVNGYYSNIHLTIKLQITQQTNYKSPNKKVQHLDKVLNLTPIKQAHRSSANPFTNHHISTQSSFKEPQPQNVP